MAYESIENLSDNDILFCTASGNDGWNLDLEKDANGNGILDAEEDLNGNGILDVSPWLRHSQHHQRSLHLTVIENSHTIPTTTSKWI